MTKKYYVFIKSIAIAMLIITFSLMINNENSANAASFFNNKNNIIPKPLSYESGKGEFVISSDTVIYVKGRTKEETEEIIKIAQYMRDKLSIPTGFQLKIIEGDNVPDNSIFLTTLNSSEERGNEGYELVVTPQKIEIIGYNLLVILRAPQSLISFPPAHL